MNLSQKITIKKAEMSIPKTENLFRLMFLNKDKRSEQTEKDHKENKLWISN